VTRQIRSVDYPVHLIYESKEMGRDADDRFYQLEMQDGDSIEVHQEQIGGSA
jgi:hypothetical protein